MYMGMIPLMCPVSQTHCDIQLYVKIWGIFLQKVKDSWRVVNHRDIIPTVPRLMGYCHVAQPVYLATGDLRNALVSNSFYYRGRLSF